MINEIYRIHSPQDAIAVSALVKFIFWISVSHNLHTLKDGVQYYNYGIWVKTVINFVNITPI